MAYDKARSVNGVALRVSRLDADGFILPGSNTVYTQKAFMSFQFTPEMEEGEEITEKNADGSICYSSQERSTLKRVTLSLSVCSPDPELEELLLGGTIFKTGDEVLGYAAPEAGTVANPDGIAIEAWSRAMNASGKPIAGAGYYHWVFPYGAFAPSGDRVMENGLMANEYEGWAVGNENFGSGPDGSWAFTSASPYQYARTNTAPVDQPGYSDYLGS